MPEAGAVAAPDKGQLSQWRSYLLEVLNQAGIPGAELDARLLLCHALNLTQTDYFVSPSRAIDDNEGWRIQSDLDRRLKGEPISRIVGFRAFWKHEFKLGPHTLDPRPDSETLIEVALELMGQRTQIPSKQGSPLRILDLGTGTGALLLSLLLEMPGATGVGVDISEDALQMARENAQLLGCADKAVFLQQNWLDGMMEKELKPFDLIVCNPPYIPQCDIDGLSREVRFFDPRRALDGGDDGLDPYREIIPQLSTFLTPDGLALFEIGEGQHEAVLKLFDDAGLCRAGVLDGAYKDLAGIVRCLAASCA